MKDLTKRQIEVFEFIKFFLRDHKYPPTIREIAFHFQISVKGAYDHVKALEKKGFLVCNTRRSRAMEVNTVSDAEEQVQVPLLGNVAAGLPLVTEKNHDQTITLPVSLVGRGKVFALRVEGDSMIDAGIRDGDLAVFVQQSDAENDQIVVVMVDEAVTLKRFFREKNRIRLQAANPAHPPLYMADLKVLGRLVALFRTYG